MKEIFNFVCIFLIGIFMTLCVISTDIVYASNENTSAKSESFTYTEFNPSDYVWADSADSSDENTGDSNSNINQKTSSDYVTTTGKAGAILRSGMVDRDKTVIVKYKLDDSYLSKDKWFSKLCSSFIDSALKHTGKPTEGDYLKFNLKGYDADTSYFKYNGTCYMTITFTFDYYTSESQENKMDTAVAKLENSLDIDDKSDYEKVKAIYKYICDNVDYNYSSSSLKYTAYNALCNKSAVCQGYATLFYRMALEYDIDTRVITGIGKDSSHAWNIVKVGNYYYNLDPTWDAGNNSFDYFLEGSGSFSNHKSDSAYRTDSFTSNYKISKYPYPCSTHEWESSYTVDKKATYESTGIKSIHCSKCNTVKPESTKTIPKLTCKLPAPSTAKAVLTSYYSSTSGYDDLKVTWSKTSGASGYYVKYRRSGTEEWKGKYTSKAYTYLKDLSDGYCYEICIYPYVSSDGNKYKSTNYKKITSARTLKKTPIASVKKRSGSYITMKWSDIKGETGYQVYRATSKSGKYSKVTTVKSKDVETYSVKLSAKKGTKYWYKIRPYKSLGDGKYVYGPWSAAVEFKR